MEQDRKHEQEMLEQMLKYASAQSLEALYDQYADGTADDSQPSEQLDNAIMQMLADAREKEQQAERAQNKAVRYRRVLRRLAAAVALVIAVGAIGGMLVMNVEAWRVPFLNFVLEMTGEETTVTFGEEEGNAGITIPDGMKRPKYIPDGFEMVTAYMDSTKGYIVYQDQQEKQIIYSVTYTDEVEIVKYADQEIQEISVNGLQGYIIPGEATNTIIWGIDEDVYKISGDVEIEELIKMAEKVM